VEEAAERGLRAVGPGAALVTATRERSLTLRFARSRATQATSVDDLGVDVVVLVDGHVGRAYANATDEDALRNCARAAWRAAEAASRAAGRGQYPGFPDPTPPRAHSGHDAETARLDPAAAGEALAAVFAVAGQVGAEASGVWTTGEVETAIASSAGAALRDRVTDAFLKVVAFDPRGRSGYAAQTAVAARALDAGAVTARAARKATTEAAELAPLPPGQYPVVMERHAGGELLWVLGRTAFNGLAHVEGRGALVGRLGTRVASPGVNVSDSPRYATTLPRAFDAEGVPKAPLALIQDGVAHRVVHDLRSAALAGAESTGHAGAAGGSEHGPLAANLVMIGGGAADADELCRPIERGIYVTRLWYTNVVRPQEALFTAVTRDGTFLIEDGRATRPLADMRITDGALGILARVKALGARSELTSDGELYGRRFASGAVCPPLRADHVRFTGSAAE